MKRRILTLLLALALVFSLAPAAFAGAETAQLSSQKLSFNGMDYSEVEKYNIDGSNYFKLRDVAPCSTAPSPSSMSAMTTRPRPSRSRPAELTIMSAPSSNSSRTTPRPRS